MLINMQGVDGTAAEARVGGGRVFIKEGVTCRPRTCSLRRRVSKSNSERSEDVVIMLRLQYVLSSR